MAEINYLAFLIQNGLEPIDWQIENKEQQEIKE